MVRTLSAPLPLALDSGAVFRQSALVPGASQGEWERRGERPLESQRQVHEIRSDQPAEPLPGSFGRPSHLPLVLQTDRIVVRGRGELSDVIRRIDDTRNVFRHRLWIRFDGASKFDKGQRYGRVAMQAPGGAYRSDWVTSLFKGTVVANGEVRISGTLRPAHTAWLVLSAPIIAAAIVLVEQGGQSWIRGVGVVAAVFAVTWQDLLLGRKRERRRRAEILEALQQIAGGVAIESPDRT